MQYKWTVLTVTTLGVLMSGIDSRILVVGLPEVAASLHADAEQAVWFTQGYVLASTIMLLLMGNISDTFGRQKLYEAGFIIFTIGSALTSLSRTPDEMIAFRLLQGIGTASLWTNSMAMITDSTPNSELGLSLGINQLASRLGGVAGLTLSGVILLFFDWPALFYINIPIGIFGTLWAHFKLKESKRIQCSDEDQNGDIESIDWIGFAAFAVFLSSLLLSLTFAAYGRTSTSYVEFLLIITVISLAFFVFHERRCRNPVLDLGLLRISEFSGSTVALLLNVTATTSLLLLLSLHLQLVVGLSPFDAGLALLPVDASLCIGAPLGGRLSDRYGKLPFLIGGLVMTSTATLLFSQVGQATSYFELSIYMILLGFGISIFLPPNASMLMSSVPQNRRGLASSIRSISWQAGLTISFNLAILIMTFTVPYGVITSVITSGSPAAVPQAYLTPFQNGLKDAFLWLAAINSAALIPTLLGARKGKTNQNSPVLC